MQHEAAYFGNVAGNTTTVARELHGGKYAIDVVGNISGNGTVTVQRLGPDGTTQLAAAAAFTANGTTTVDMPDGQYSVVTSATNASAVYVTIARIPTS